jgi:chorismate dehydratase
MKMIRVGKIAFTNILPLYHYANFSDLPVELVSKVPSQLNRGMAEGSIDVGPISAFTYAEDYPNYVLMPDLSVSAKGQVRSIFLFSKYKDFTAVKDGKIALPNTSATSIHLLKILLEYMAGGKPTYTTEKPNVNAMMEHADAALLIGDDALLASWHNQNYYAFDLGWQWYKETGLPMTFAVWAVRRQIVEHQMELLFSIYERFLNAKQRSKKEPMPVIQAAMKKLGGDVATWQEYYTGLTYDFGIDERRGLATYYHYAQLAGLIEKDINIEVLDLTCTHLS